MSEDIYIRVDKPDTKFTETVKPINNFDKFK